MAITITRGSDYGGDRLPPCGWANHGGFEVFAVGEPLCDDLVTWFVRVGRQWFELNESRSINAGRLLSLCLGSH